MESCHLQGSNNSIKSPLLQSIPFSHQEASIIMGNSFRRQPLGTLYPDSKTPVTEDLLQDGLLFAFGIIAFSFIVIIPGIRGLEVSSIRVLVSICNCSIINYCATFLQRIWATLRVFIALWIGAVLLVCNFTSWYGDEICTQTQYRAHTDRNAPQLIQADVGLSIGLRGINITLLERACPGKTTKNTTTMTRLLF